MKKIGGKLRNVKIEKSTESIENIRRKGGDGITMKLNEREKSKHH